jgi:riboflavin synthase
MFTGIVNKKLQITQWNQQKDLVTLALDLGPEMLEALKIGASVGINGTCLTVTRIEGIRVFFDAMIETLRVTNLEQLSLGSWVNVERAARFDDEIGGHLLSGHVHGQVSLLEIEKPENNCILWFSLPPEFCEYVLPKGYIGLNGCSLTIGEVLGDRFCVYLIPETLRITTFGNLEVGDKINLEIDSQTQAVVDTVKRMALSGQLSKLLA